MDSEARKLLVNAEKALISAVLYMVTQFEEGSLESDMGHALFPVATQLDDIRKRYHLEEKEVLPF